MPMPASGSPEDGLGDGLRGLGLEARVKQRQRRGGLALLELVPAEKAEQ